MRRRVDRSVSRERADRGETLATESLPIVEYCTELLGTLLRLRRTVTNTCGPTKNRNYAGARGPQIAVTMSIVTTLGQIAQQVVVEYQSRTIAAVAYRATRVWVHSCRTESLTNRDPCFG